MWRLWQPVRRLIDDEYARLHARVDLLREEIRRLRKQRDMFKVLLEDAVRRLALAQYQIDTLRRRHLSGEQE